MANRGNCSPVRLWACFTRGDLLHVLQREVLFQISSCKHNTSFKTKDTASILCGGMGFAFLMHQLPENVQNEKTATLYVSDGVAWIC